MVIYKVIYEKNGRQYCKFLNRGEFERLLDKCHKRHYRIVNIEHA